MNTKFLHLRYLLPVFLGLLNACGGGFDKAPAPGALQFAETSYDVAEGESVDIMVVRSGGSGGTVSVDYATSDGTAVSGSDYPASSGTLAYVNSTRSMQTISIFITDDDSAEGPESFTMTLSNAKRLTEASFVTLGANSSVTINIIDNDTAALPITGDNAQDITVAVLKTIASTVEIIDILDVIGLPAIACDTGEANATWNDADNNFVISSGDTFDIVFVMCFLADSEKTLDGATSLTNMVVTGYPFEQIAPWGLALTFGFDNLSSTDSAGTAIINDDLDVDLSSDDNVVVNLSLSTTFLTAQLSGITTTLSDYVLTETIDLNTLTQVVSANGTLTSALLEGSVTFETPQNFVAIGGGNPSAGQLLISDNSSSVLVPVLDNISVQLEIDHDLDGTIEQTRAVTWSELDIE